MARTSRRGPWLPEEDSALIELVRTQGPNNWVRISQQLQHRSPKQCRERYHQNLKPSLNHDPISAQEGERIEQLVDEMGKRWAEIARRLGNRSDNAVKNWWNGSINRRKRSPSSQSAVRHGSNRLHPVTGGPSHLPAYDHADHTAPAPGSLAHGHHFRDPWATASAVPPIHMLSSAPEPEPEPDQYVGRTTTFSAASAPASSRNSEQQRLLDPIPYDPRPEYGAGRSRLPPLRLPPITGARTNLGYISGRDKPSVSPALSDHSHPYSTRPVPSLMSDNQSNCSVSPKTLTSPQASATHYTDARSQRWAMPERPQSFSYQGIRGQVALSPLQIETLVMPPMLNPLGRDGSRYPSMHYRDSPSSSSFEPPTPKRIESLRDSRMHVSSLVQ